MSPLTQIALLHSNNGVFTGTELSCWVRRSPAARFGLVKRAIASGEVLHLKRNLYCLKPGLPGVRLDPMTLAHRLSWPSYISFEMALAYHGIIPEAVHTITCACATRATAFHTPQGHFSYTSVPQRVFFEGVERIESGAGGIIFVANPVKALADLVYTRKSLGTRASDVFESLRIDKDDLETVAGENINALRENYSSNRVKTFLCDLLKELKQ